MKIFPPKKFERVLREPGRVGNCFEFVIIFSFLGTTFSLHAKKFLRRILSKRLRAVNKKIPALGRDKFAQNYFITAAAILV